MATFIVAGLFSVFFLLFAKPNKHISKKSLSKSQPAAQAKSNFNNDYRASFDVQYTNLKTDPSKLNIYNANLNEIKNKTNTVHDSTSISFGSPNNSFQPILNKTSSGSMNSAMKQKGVENALLNPTDSASPNHLIHKQTLESDSKPTQEVQSSYGYIDAWDTSTAKKSQKDTQAKVNEFKPSTKPDRNNLNTIAFNSSKKNLPVRTSIPYSINANTPLPTQKIPQEAVENPQNEDENESLTYTVAEKNNFSLKLESGLCLEEHYLSHIKTRLLSPPDYIPQEHTKAPERIQCIGFSGQLNIIFDRDHVLLDKPGIDFILHIPVPSMKGPKKMANVYGIKDDQSYPLGQIIMGSNGSGEAGFDLSIFDLDSIHGIMISDLEVVTDENVRQYCSTNSLPNVGFSIDAIELVHYFVEKNNRDGDT